SDSSSVVLPVPGRPTMFRQPPESRAAPISFVISSILVFHHEQLTRLPRPPDPARHLRPACPVTGRSSRSIEECRVHNRDCPVTNAATNWCPWRAPSSPHVDIERRRWT